MSNLTVKHYLKLYSGRKRMQENCTSNPTENIKAFTRALVERLESMPLDEEITLDNQGFYDSKGRLILSIPLMNKQ